MVLESTIQQNVLPVELTDRIEHEKDTIFCILVI